MADRGLDSVRIFLTWEAFQPAPDRVDAVMLERLVTVADLAEQAGIAIMPTLFTGHMSGVNLIPGWALGGADRDPRFRVLSGGRLTDEGLRDWYGDPVVAEAQAWFAGQAATALAGHPALWAWDLGNESSNCVRPPTARAPGTGWRAPAPRSAAADPAARVTIGLHMEDLEEDRLLGPAEAAAECDFLTMHGYPIYADWADGPTDEHLLPFLAHLTSWLGGGAEVLFSEFGAPTYRATDRRPGAGPPGRCRRAPRGADRRRLHGPRAGHAPREPGASGPCCGASPTTRPPPGTARRSTRLATSGPSACGGRTARPSRRWTPWRPSPGPSSRATCGTTTGSTSTPTSSAASPGEHIRRLYRRYRGRSDHAQVSRPRTSWSGMAAMPLPRSEKP